MVQCEDTKIKDSVRRQLFIKSLNRLTYKAILTLFDKMARKREYTGKDIYTVEEIKDKKIEKKTTYYLIKWKNYSDKHNSWEPEENVSEALIAGYESCSKPGPKTSSDEKGEQGN